MKMEWFHWWLSKELWGLVRPWIKLLMGEDINVSECGDGIDLAVHTYRSTANSIYEALEATADQLRAKEV